MRKYMWAVIAGVCVVALVAAGAIIVVRMLAGTSGDSIEEIVEPAHWWKMTLNQDQADIWRETWGENATMAQLIDAVWPGVLQEIPAEAALSLGKHTIGWPTDGRGNVLTMDDSLGYSMVFCAGFSLPAAQPDTEPQRSFYYYIGTEAWERSTPVNRDPDRTPDMLYRISIYTDDVRTDNPGPSPSAVHL